MFVGVIENRIAIVYAVNKESEEDYQNGNWEYTGCEYRVIHRLCVNPAYQHQGIAAETLAHIEEKLHKSNIKAVRLDVYSLNSAAQSLYFGSGYKKVGFVDWKKGRFYLLEKLL
ncbi:MAG: GNAT family N-acetyltransferase [Clostridiales bacterium]|nr:GNAT family N-acetyltransferase [Clostridiales bacterium]